MLPKKGDEIRDTSGNVITISPEGVCHLKLADGSKKRKIGAIHKDGVFTTWRSCTFEKFKAFGFCHALIEYLNPKEIWVYYEGSTYKIDLLKFKEQMKFLRFSEKGFELQVFVPLAAFEERGKA